MANGIAESSRKSGAHARGRNRGHARGRSRCLHQPKFPTLGVVLTHPIGGEISPGMKSGIGPSTIPHHPGSPRSQSRSRLASMTLGGDMPYNSLVLFISRVPEYEVPSGPNLVHPLDGGRMGCCRQNFGIFRQHCVEVRCKFVQYFL